MSSLVPRVRHKFGRILQNLSERIDPPGQPELPVSELHMVWPAARLGQPPQWSIPEGYRLRTYQPNDEPIFFDLMEQVGFPGWTMPEFEKYVHKIVPDGFFFLIHEANQQIVATAMGMHNSSPLHPFGASLSCVGVLPAYQGKHLGRLVSSVVTERLIRAGYQDIYLITHDWRLPAIKTYLKMGWLPFIYEEDMPHRWEAVCQQLDWPCNFSDWSTLPGFTIKPSQAFNENHSPTTA